MEGNHLLIKLIDLTNISLRLSTGILNYTLQILSVSDGTVYSFDTLYGGYDLDIQDRTLLLTIRGVVELELALRFMLQAKVMISQLPHNHWASLVDLRDWGLHPPEVVDFLYEFQHWAEDNGQLAEAAVVSDSVLKVLARDKLREGVRKTVHQEYFVTRHEADEWLHILSFLGDADQSHPHAV